MATGIPTIYKGIRFRSRLEAKWACFFDMIGQKWQYEPFDLPGWIPDFFLFNNKNGYRGFSKKALIEVKPTLNNVDEINKKITRAMMGSPDHHQFNLAILGNGPEIQENGFPIIGYGGWINPCECYWKAMREGVDIRSEITHFAVKPETVKEWHEWGPIYLSVPSIESNTLEIFHSEDYEAFIEEIKTIDEDVTAKEIEKSNYLASFLWTYCSNETQWNPSRRNV